MIILIYLIIMSFGKFFFAGDILWQEVSIREVLSGFKCGKMQRNY